MDAARTVRVDSIEVKHNYREKTAQRAKEVEALATSIALLGLLQPIGLVAVGKKYELVFGEKRLDAVRSLGWEEIPAMVFASVGEAENYKRQLAENVQRSNPSPVEDATALALLLDNEAQAKTGKPYSSSPKPIRDECVASVAAAMGVSETWVRDRAYIARLSDSVRDMVAAQTLPLSHAREIAKVLEHGEQEAIAKLVCAGAKDERPASIDVVRELCSRKILSLRQVPWILSEPFAGRPACSECPHNAANDPQLFGESEPACANRECFAAKRRECAKVVRHATDAVIADIDANKAKHRSIQEHKPAYILHSALVGSVQSAIAIREGTEAIAEEAAKGGGVMTRKEQEARAIRKEAERQYALLAEQRTQRVNAAMRSWFAQDQTRALLWELVAKLKIMIDASSFDENTRGRAVRSPSLRRAVSIVKQTPERALEELVGQRFSKHGMAGYRAFDERSFAAQSGVPDIAADILEIEVPGETLPDREAWIGQYIEYVKSGKVKQ